VVKRFK